MVSLFVCPLGQYGLYVESIFSHCLAVSSVFLALVVTCLYAQPHFPNPPTIGSISEINLGNFHYIFSIFFYRTVIYLPPTKIQTTVHQIHGFPLMINMSHLMLELIAKSGLLVDKW